MLPSGTLHGNKDVVSVKGSIVQLGSQLYS